MFSSFRDLMDLGDLYVWFEVAANRIEAILDGSGFILFFEKDGDVFGAGEDSRVVFAKLKHPDKDLPKGWQEEANFTAHNLTRLIKGETAPAIFSKKDINEIKVMDRDKVLEKLQTQAKANEKLPEIIKLDTDGQKDSDQALNFIQADEA